MTGHGVKVGTKSLQIKPFVRGICRLDNNRFGFRLVLLIWYYLPRVTIALWASSHQGLNPCSRSFESVQIVAIDLTEMSDANFKVFIDWQFLHLTSINAINEVFGRSRGGTDAPSHCPKLSQFIQFLENLAKLYAGVPWRVRTPSYGESCIRSGSLLKN